MRTFLQRSIVAALLGAALLLITVSRAAAEDTINWNTNRNLVSADIKSAELLRVLEGVAKLTGWQVYLEENTSLNVSVKFKNLPSGEALRAMLKNLNFALVPEEAGRSRLYVFRTSQQNATQVVHPADLNPAAAAPKKIANELVVTLRPGTNIEELAKLLGAKVIGSIDGLNVYRLQFADEDAANAARQQLAGNSNVETIDSNYVVDAPPSAMKLSSAAAGGAPPVQLKLNPPADGSGRVVVGLIDTAIQPLGNDLDKFLIKSLSVAGEGHADPDSPTHGTSMFENMLRAASQATGGSSSIGVISVDVYGSDPTTSTFSVAAGIVQAINNGANVINLSLGSPGDAAFMRQLVQQVSEKGIPMFAAAGNNSSAQQFYPAAYPEVTAVTAQGGQGKLASYANYGSFVDLIAPGTSVVYLGQNPYLVSGTSTATAFISGLTAGVADSKHISTGSAATAVGNTPAFKFTQPK